MNPSVNIVFYLDNFESNSPFLNTGSKVLTIIRVYTFENLKLSRLLIWKWKNWNYLRCALCLVISLKKLHGGLLARHINSKISTIPMDTT